MRTLIAALALVCATQVHAAQFELDFVASGFTSLWDPEAPPEATISGSLTWSAASFGAPIDQILSVNLTISGFTYTTSDLVFLNETVYNSNSVVGGNEGYGANVIGAGRNDFAIWFDRFGPAIQFYYATPSTNNVWLTTAVAGDVQALAVPEPSTALMLAGGVVALGTARRLRRNC